MNDELKSPDPLARPARGNDAQTGRPIWNRRRLLRVSWHPSPFVGAAEHPTFRAIRRTVELVGEGNPLERGLIEAVITGRSPLDAGARVPYPSR